MPLLDISRVPQRWLVCALLTWAFAIIGYEFTYFRKIKGIIESASESSSRYSDSNECSSQNSTKSSSEKKEQPFELSDLYTTPSLMYMAEIAFLLGRYVMLMPAAVASDLGFSKHVLFLGILLLALSHLGLSKELYVLSQMFWGVSEAFIYPSAYSLVSRWTPPSKLHLFMALIWYGYIFGHYLAGGLVFKYAFSLSWSEGNVISGLLMLLWVPFGYVFIYNSPSQSPFINRQLPNTSNRNRGHRSFWPQLLVRLRKIPWCKILLSCQFLSFILAYCSMEWFALVNLYSHLKYYKDYVLHIPNLNNWPFILGIFLFPPFMTGALFSDWVVHRKILSRTAATKIMVFISVFVSTFLQVTVVLIGCTNAAIFWSLFFTSYFFHGLAVCNINICPVVLSPWNAGVLIALTVAVKSFLKIVSTYISQFIFDERFSSTLHRLRFEVICYSILSMALLVPFLVFGSAEVQNWNRMSSVNTGRTVERTSSSPI